MIKRAALNTLEVYLAPAIFVALFLFTTGAFFDASDDAVISLLLRGEIGGAPIAEFPRFYFFIAPLLQLLYEYIPTVAWLGVFFVLVNYFICVGVLQLINTLLERRYKAEIYGIFLITLILALSENLMYYNMNRVSILASGIGLVLILRPGNNALGWGLFIIGMCVRPYGGLLAISLVFPAVWLLQTKKNYSQLIFTGIVFLALYFGFYKGLDTFSEEQRQRNKIKSTILDFERRSDQKLALEDSLLIEAVHEGYYQDASISVSMMKEYTGGSRWSVTNLTGQKLGRFIKNIWWSISRNYQVLILLNVLLLLVFRDKKGWLLALYFWIIMVIIGVFLKLPEKLFSPALMLWSLVQILLLGRYWNKVTAWVKITALAFTLLYIVKIVHRTNVSIAIRSTHEQTITELNTSFRGKMLYMTKFNYLLTYLDPLTNYDFQTANLLTLTGWPTLLPEYTETFTYVCDSKSFKDLFTCAVNSNEEETIIVFHTKEGMPFLKEYLNRIHGLDVNFVLIEDVGTSEKTNRFWPYRIEHAISKKD